MSRALLFVLCSSMTALCAAAADDLALAPTQGVLLLNNGELISGTITAAGDRYDVDLKDGQIYVKRSEVAIVCRNAQECYVHKRAGIEEGRAADHLDLADWCLRNGLLDMAEKEIAEARAADSGHPRIRLLEPRLKLAKQGPKSAQPASAPEKSVSVEQLDSLVRNLPAGSMESFTNTVQPMLLNHCTKSGCHGPRSTNALRLERIAPNRLAGRHPTQRNLQAALALVDREKPDESKLLQAPLRPHGTLKAPVFTDREQSQYRQLVQWVYLVAGTKESSARLSLEERGAPLLQTIPRQGRPAAVEPSQATPSPARQESDSDAQPRPDRFPDQAGPLGERASTGQPLRVARMHGPLALRAAPKQAEPSKDFVPKDPFDPEIFNRRFSGE